MERSLPQSEAHRPSHYFDFPPAHLDEVNGDSDATALRNVQEDPPAEAGFFAGSHPQRVPIQSSLPIQPMNPFRTHQSSQSSLLSSPPLTPEATPLYQKPSKLGDYFARGGEHKTFSDGDIQEISRHLSESGREAWSQAPRLYAVLRTIGQLQILDTVLDEGISDIWFPFAATAIPKALSSTSRATFLKAQPLVLTKAVDLEKTRKHAHFGKEDVFPFEVRERLGRGAYGTVDKIFSPFSRREFARKKFVRRSGQSKAEVQSFKTELQVLKRIEHHHCVELIASYTDSKYFGLIMSPVADSNLTVFYTNFSGSSRNLDLLRGFYGCLANGLSYLHQIKIRHRDIKPENILVKDSHIYLSDFGISLDWESLSGSTTTDDTAKSWIYCAPEVANYQKRNSSSDIWSLGCIFLEMSTLLKGQDIDIMRRKFKERTDTHRFYQNLPIIRQWMHELRGIGLSSDNKTLDWSLAMLNEDQNARPSADVLCAAIVNGGSSQGDGTAQFFGECCAVNHGADSTAESASDGDLWADDIDEEFVSPLSTDPSLRSPNVSGDLCVDIAPFSPEVSTPPLPTVQTFPSREILSHATKDVKELRAFPTAEESSSRQNVSPPTKHVAVTKPFSQVELLPTPRDVSSFARTAPAYTSAPALANTPCLPPSPCPDTTMKDKNFARLEKLSHVPNAERQAKEAALESSQKDVAAQATVARKKAEIVPPSTAVAVKEDDKKEYKAAPTAEVTTLPVPGAFKGQKDVPQPAQDVTEVEERIALETVFNQKDQYEPAKSTSETEEKGASNPTFRSKFSGSLHPSFPREHSRESTSYPQFSKTHSREAIGPRENLGNLRDGIKVPHRDSKVENANSASSATTAKPAAAESSLAQETSDASPSAISSFVMPIIRFQYWDDPSPLTKPSLAFDDISRTLPQRGSILRVGRHSEPDADPDLSSYAPPYAPVVFHSMAVSHRHCEIWYSEGQWYIKDVASSGGTFLNHTRLSQSNVASKPLPMYSGDILQLGMSSDQNAQCVKMRVVCTGGSQLPGVTQSVPKVLPSARKFFTRIAKS